LKYLLKITKSGGARTRKPVNDSKNKLIPHLDFFGKYKIKKTKMQSIAQKVVFLQMLKNY